MKFRSTIKSIAIMLIACGVLLGGCQYTYVSVAAANTIEQEQTGTSSLTKFSDAKDEEQTGFDSDKSVNTSDDKNTKVAGNTKKVVPDPQKELDIRLSDLSRQVDESAPGFTLWLALLGLAMAVISIVAFLFVRNNYDKRLRGSNDKLVKIQNDLERLKGDFRALKQSFEEQRGYVHNLSRRAEMDRKRELREESQIPELLQCWKERKNLEEQWKISLQSGEQRNQWENPVPQVWEQEHCWFADRATIRKNDYNFTVGRYKPWSEEMKKEEESPLQMLRQLEAMERETLKQMRELIEMVENYG